MIKCTADLNGDGETDVLLVNPTTNVTERQLIKNGVGQTPVLMPSWTAAPVQGLADANGDGKKDVLYLYGTKQIAVFLDGTTKIGQSVVSGKVVDAIGPLTGSNFASSRPVRSCGQHTHAGNRFVYWLVLGGGVHPTLYRVTCCLQ